MRVASASRPPRVPIRVRPWLLAAAAAASVALWLSVEFVLPRPTNPRFAEMLNAARAMQAASTVLVAEKQARGILAPPANDPNRTGMIGEEYTGMTTTLGELASKRTATNPDFAAALVRQIDKLHLARGTPVVIVVSGSFVGGNIAAVAAVEALGLRPVLVASLGASMWGANDPGFNWLDMAAVLRARGVIQTQVLAAVLGGDAGLGKGMDPKNIGTLRASAAEHGVPLVEASPFSALIDDLLDRVRAAVGVGYKPGLAINVGGAEIGLGDCREASELQPGLYPALVSCSAGTPGVIMRLSEEGVPMLHVLNLRRLALEWGLPFDPVPLPTPGNNTAVYGTPHRN